QVAAEVCRLQIQLPRHLAQQIQRRARGEVYVQDLVQIGMEGGGEGARGCGFARAHFAGEQAHAVMLGQELEPRFDLIPSFGGEQLFGVGAVGKRGFLEAEERFPHRYLSSLSQGGSCPLTTASTRRATPCHWPSK